MKKEPTRTRLGTKCSGERELPMQGSEWDLTGTKASQHRRDEGGDGRLMHNIAGEVGRGQDVKGFVN